MTQKSFAKGSAFPPLKPGLLRLYSMRFCPYAQRTRLVLAHKNIPYETINVNLVDKPEWFFEKNPLGLVPTLELDDKIIYESTATCEWLDDVYTQNRLQPTDPYVKAWDRILLEYFGKNPLGLVPTLELDDKIIYESTATCEWLDDVYSQNRLQPTDPYVKAWDRILLEYFGKVATAFYSFLRKPDEREKLLEEFQKYFQFYNDILAKRGGPLFGGEKPSMIDFYLWPHFERVPVLQTIDSRLEMDKCKFPSLVAWFESMLQVPAVKATKWDVDFHLRYYNSSLSGKPDYDMDLEE